MKFIYLLILFKIIILCTRNSAFQLQVALFSINISTYLQLVRPLSRAVNSNGDGRENMVKQFPSCHLQNVNMENTQANLRDLRAGTTTANY